jgi:hypothetical protein
MVRHSLGRKLTRLAAAMAQGSLSEITRRCGNPTCACASDPARQHGPHLYWKFTSEGQATSIYVPPASAPAIKRAHAAWVRFLGIGATLSARNRRALLRQLRRAKDQARTAPRAPRRPRHA